MEKIKEVWEEHPSWVIVGSVVVVFLLWVLF